MSFLVSKNLFQYLATAGKLLNTRARGSNHNGDKKRAHRLISWSWTLKDWNVQEQRQKKQREAGGKTNDPAELLASPLVKQQQQQLQMGPTTNYSSPITLL